MKRTVKRFHIPFLGFLLALEGTSTVRVYCWWYALLPDVKCFAEGLARQGNPAFTLGLTDARSIGRCVGCSSPQGRRHRQQVQPQHPVEPFTSAYGLRSVGVGASVDHGIAWLWSRGHCHGHRDEEGKRKKQRTGSVTTFLRERQCLPCQPKGGGGVNQLRQWQPSGSQGLVRLTGGRGRHVPQRFGGSIVARNPCVALWRLRVRHGVCVRRNGRERQTIPSTVSSSRRRSCRLRWVLATTGTSTG